MSNLEVLHHDGLELPVYDATEVKCLKTEYQDMAYSGLSTFVRFVRTSGPDETLRSRLKRAEWCFERIAKYCNIQIAPHTWGVCEDTPEIPVDRRLTEKLLPSGYLLVAEVDIIHPNGEPPLDRVDAFNEGVVAYDLQVLKKTANAHRDLNLGQVVYGTNNRLAAKNTDQKPDMWFVDIEPLVGQQTLSMPSSDAFTNSYTIIG